MKKRIIIFFIAVSLIGISGLKLFCSGAFDEDNLDNPGMCYNEKWLDNIISAELPPDKIPKIIKVENCNAKLTIHTHVSAASLHYSIKGLPEHAVKVKSSSSELVITEEEIRPKNRRSGKKKDRIIAYIDLVIPSSAVIDKLTVNSNLGRAEITGISCTSFALNAGINQVKVSDVKCKNLDVEGSIGFLEMKNILCDDCKIETSVGDTRIENISVENKTALKTSVGSITVENGNFKNPGLSINGGFNFKGTFEGKVKIESGIGHVDMDLQNSNKIDEFDINGSVGNIELKNFTANMLKMKFSVGNTKIKNVLADKAFIETSNGSTYLDNCILKDAAINLSIGKFDFSGILKGACSIERSIGSVNLHIKDSRNNYGVFFEDAFRSNIKINGESVFTIGNQNAKNTLHIKGGNGSFSIKFLD